MRKLLGKSSEKRWWLGPGWSYGGAGNWLSSGHSFKIKPMISDLHCTQKKRTVKDGQSFILVKWKENYQ
jgi:hypothetical protein